MPENRVIFIRQIIQGAACLHSNPLPQSTPRPRLHAVDQPAHYALTVGYKQLCPSLQKARMQSQDNLDKGQKVSQVLRGQTGNFGQKLMGSKSMVKMHKSIAHFTCSRQSVFLPREAEYLAVLLPSIPAPTTMQSQILNILVAFPFILVQKSKCNNVFTQALFPSYLQPSLTLFSPS